MNTSQSINEEGRLPTIGDRDRSNSQSQTFKAVQKHQKNLSNVIKQKNAMLDSNEISIQKKQSLESGFRTSSTSFLNQLKGLQQSSQTQEQQQNSSQKNKFKKLQNIITTSFLQETQKATDNSATSTSNYYFNQNRSNRNQSFTMKDIFLNTTNMSQQTRTKSFKTNSSVINTQPDESKQTPTNTSLNFSYQKFKEILGGEKLKTLQKSQNQSYSNVSNLHNRGKSYDMNENPFENNPILPFTNSPLLNVSQIEKVAFLRSNKLIGSNPKASNPQYLSDIDLLKQKINQSKDINTEDQFIQKVKNLSLHGQKNINFPHNSQNSSLKKSSERKDLHLLNQWMEQMLEQMFDKEKKYWNYEDFFDQMETIYTGCVHEVARQLFQESDLEKQQFIFKRQVSIECSERGQIVMNVWNTYTSIVRQFLAKSQSQFLEKETEQLQIQKNVQILYQNDVNSLQNENKLLNETIELRNNQISKAKAENRQIVYLS